MSNSSNERPEPHDIEVANDVCRVFIPEIDRWVNVDNEDEARYLSGIQGFLYDVGLRLHYQDGYPERLERAAEVCSKYEFDVLSRKLKAFSKAGRERRSM